MPRYLFSGETSKKFGDTVFPPNGAMDTLRYYTDDELGFLSHNPSVSPLPIKQLTTPTVASGETSDLTVDQNYNSVSIYNGSGAMLYVSFNDDLTVERTISVPNAQWWVVDNKLHNVGVVNLRAASLTDVLVIQYS